jgi:membrane-bound metal-dependent hydrolase YbcI (DUF457 family)
MDFLTHLFLPLTVAYVLRRELFVSPAYLLLAGFGLLSDFDKFLGYPGLLHSLITLVPISLCLLLGEKWLREKLVLSPLIVAFIFSHLLLDFIGGGPVPLLYPVIDGGVGLQYPVQTVFGEGFFGLSFRGQLLAVRTTAPRPGFNTYGFIKGYGVASTISFVILYLGLRYRNTTD